MEWHSPWRNQVQTSGSRGNPPVSNGPVNSNSNNSQHPQHRNFPTSGRVGGSVHHPHHNAPPPFRQPLPPPPPSRSGGTTRAPLFHRPVPASLRTSGVNAATSMSSSAPAWTPDHSSMSRRRAFREKMVQETKDHRRLHPHESGMTRNIVDILYDRQSRGPRAWSYHRPKPARRVPDEKRDLSPATVFDSPVSTAANDVPYGDEIMMRMMHDEEEGEDSTLPKRVIGPIRLTAEIRYFMEYISTVHYHSAFLRHLGGDDQLDEAGNRPPSSRAISTISVAFSPDSQTMASTHGDHTVKISSCRTGRLLQSLEGHPRTPWTVKYHPTDPLVVASGCLGHQVRVWNWKEKACLQMVRLEFAIISLTFHPSGKVLAVANGTRLHFWGVDARSSEQQNSRSSLDNADHPPHLGGPPIHRSAALTEMDQRHMLRCVHFPPDGKTLIIGGVNPTNEDPRRRTRPGIGGGGMSFYLRLWDFDLDLALRPTMDVTASGITVPRRPVSNPRTFVPRALLYNDGGFDVSPDGKTLCACIEYWLPDGVDNAMELVNQEELQYLQDLRDEEEGVRHSRPEDYHQSREVSQSSQMKSISADATTSTPNGRSPSFRESMDTSQDLMSITPVIPRTPIAQYPVTAAGTGAEYIPRTPEIPSSQAQLRLSPPPPPGRRFIGGLRNSTSGAASSAGRDAVSTSGSQPVPDERGISTPPPPPPPPPPPAPGPVTSRPPHPLSTVTSGAYPEQFTRKGRYVPHVVTVSLDSSPLPERLVSRLYTRGKPYPAVAVGHRPRLGQILEAYPLDGAKASAVTCVKFSPSTDFCLIGYGVREPISEGGGNFHPVTAVYRIRGGMAHISTMLSADDDVNIARFHPDSGHGFVYGTKQGRVRVLSTKPWMYYNC